MPVGLLIAACCAVPVALAGAVLFSGVKGRVRRWASRRTRVGAGVGDTEPQEIQGGFAPNERSR